MESIFNHQLRIPDSLLPLILSMEKVFSLGLQLVQGQLVIILSLPVMPVGTEYTLILFILSAEQIFL